MKYLTVELSENDRKILNSYIIMAEGLADYLGEGYEIVLHSLESFDNSVIKIINGHHTGRREGSPITDLGLSLLSTLDENPSTNFISYFNKNKNNEPLKSCTIAIRGEHKQVIGLFCINLYLNTPFASILQNFFPTTAALQENSVSENFVENVDELLQEALDEAKRLIYNDYTISASNKNKEIISFLYSKGIFNLKDSVVCIAEKLGISKNTVYMHIRNLNAK